MARKHWLLKVVAGPHQGAEMRLTEGQVLIGKDDDCDVVLHDALVAPQHFALDLNGSGIFVAPLGGRVYCAGKRIKEARESVPPFSFITIGGTHLVIGPADDKWPLLSPADIPQLEPDAPETPPTPEAAQAAPETPGAAPVAAAPVRVEHVSEGQRRRGLWGVFVGVLLLVVWFFIWQYWNPDFFKVRHEKPLSDLARAQSVVNASGFENRVKVEDQAGRLLATGYVDTEIQQHQIQAALRDEVPSIVPKIWSLDKILGSARAKLNEQHLTLELSALPDGKLKAAGQLTVAQSEAWQRAKQVLLTDIPGLRGVIEEVTLPPPPPPAPKEPIVAAPTYAPEPAIQAATIEKPEAESEPRVAYIKSRKDGLNWVRLTNGDMFFKGATLPDGSLILEITPAEVRLERGDLLRSVKSGELLWNLRPSVGLQSLPNSEVPKRNLTTTQR